MADHAHFDFDELTAAERYKLLAGTVTPRPIALVTTVDAEGRVNAAPYSFFNVLAADPPILAIGVGTRPDRSAKDTGANIRLTGELTVNLVDDAMAEAMATCAVAFPPEVDEIAQAGLTAIPGQAVACPRIAESPVSFECKLFQSILLSPEREIVMARVVGMFLRAELEGERKRVDQKGLDILGRMGGHGYGRMRDLFVMKTPGLDDWEAGRGPVREDL